MSERIEHIRENLAEFDSLAERFVYESYPHDVSYLLERNERLETVNKALKAQKDPDNPPIPWDKSKADLRIDELEQENERLKKMLNLYTDEELESMRRADEMTPELRARLKTFMENEE